MEGSTCQYCGTAIEGPVIFCSNCDTPHHKECFLDNGRCTTYACDCTSYVDGKTGQRHTLNSGPRQQATIPGKGKAPPPPQAQQPPINRLGTLIFGTALLAYFMLVIAPKMSAQLQNSGVPIPEQLYQISDAIDKNDFAKVKRYVDGGTPLFYEWDKMFPLHRATLFGRTKMVRLLVRAGAPTNIVGKCGTWLDCARASQDRSMVQLCKELGAKEIYNPGDRRKQDNTRFWACSYSKNPPPRSLLTRKFSLER